MGIAEGAVVERRTLTFDRASMSAANWRTVDGVGGTGSDGKVQAGRWAIASSMSRDLPRPAAPSTE